MKQVMLIMILVIVLSGKINNREFNIMGFRFVLGLHFRCVTVTKFSDFLIPLFFLSKSQYLFYSNTSYRWYNGTIPFQFMDEWDYGRR